MRNVMQRLTAFIVVLVMIRLGLLLVHLTVWVLYKGLSADYRVFGIVGVLVVALLPVPFLISWWIHRLNEDRSRRARYGITPELRERLNGSMVTR